MKKEFLIEALSKYGTSHLYDVINNNIEMGRTYNGLSSRFTENIDISPETLRTKYYDGRHGCFSCTVACRHKYLIKRGRIKDYQAKGLNTVLSEISVLYAASKRWSLFY